ncbi:PREDICTED: ionotropic receptor 25a [Nicrophorus vespilloides]|uniref:Ionotropic receptor 25a n=1 Tax=Nicrophorus vespilloides TaxID=110193 RepID=A0ABM1NJH6_NICVS|nr:PREDICTED: ionotropic receptor 25a [Nicrophorus vespilloides]
MHGRTKMRKIHVAFAFLLCFINSIRAQTTQNINVLFVNEEGNLVAEKAVDVALDYVKRNTKLGVKVDMERVVGNRTDAKGLLDSLCKTYNDMLDSKKQPNVVLDLTMTGLASETVKSFTAALGLPTISGSFGQQGDLRQWRNIDQNQQQYLIQIMPPADVIPEIIRSIVLNQNISNAAILYDESFVMDHKFKSLLQNVATRHVIAPISPDNQKDQLMNLRKLDIVNFFVLGSLNNIKRVLDAADGVSFFNRKYAWHAITQDKGDIKCVCRNATVMFAKPTLDNQYQDRNGLIRTSYQLNADPEIAASFYFDLALHTFLTIKDIISEGAWPGNMSYITCDDYNGKNTPERPTIDIKKYFNKENSETPVYGPLKIISNGLSSMEFSMQLSAVGIREGSSDKSVQLGSWKAGFNNNLTLLNPQSMTNYTADVVYRVVTVLQQPFIFKDEKAPKKFSGYCIDLIDQIAEILKFDYEIVPVQDGKFGNMDEKGNWNGIVKELIDKKADIGLGSMSVMAERENVIDFTVPYYDLVGITILMKLPKTPTSLFKFLTVLENDVWLCILAAYFFTSFLMWVFDRWSPYSYQNNREKYKDDEEKREFNLKECLWFCMTSLTPQGGGEAPKNLSGRLVAATWWLFGFIIIASYTANLAAFLTVSRLDTPVESLDDLSKQYKIQYAPLNGSSAMTYFERMADIELRFYEIWKDMSLNDSLTDVERAKLAVWDYPVSDKYTKMWQAMKEATLPNTLDEAVKRVRESRSSSEGFAFLGDATDIKYLTLTNCDLQMVGEEFSRKPYAIAVQQGSPLRDQFNTAILQLLNKRQLERFKEKWWTNNPKAIKCEKQDDQSDGISIQNIGGVFIVIFVGIGLACITLAFEYWWYKYRKGSKVIAVQEAQQTRPPKNLPRDDFKQNKLYPRSRF